MNETVIAYMDSEWSEILCAEHGKVRNEQIKVSCELDGCDFEDCELFAISTWASEELSCVEYCGAGHSFCGNCGSDMSDAEDVKGDFALCSNCGLTSLFVDGVGYVYVGEGHGFGSALEYVNIDLMGYTCGLLSDMLRVTKINAIVDDTRNRGLGSLHLYVAYASMFPEYGTVLVLTDGDRSGWEAAQAHFSDLADEHGEDDEYTRALCEDVTMLGGLRPKQDFVIESK